MKAETETMEGRFERLRASTEQIAPPADFASRVLTRVRDRKVRPSWWAALVPLGRSAVPLAALAAAAAIALAAVGEARVDDTITAAIDLAGGTP